LFEDVGVTGYVRITRDGENSQKFATWGKVKAAQEAQGHVVEPTFFAEMG
jgi:ribosomal 30S subunit maturation factor RimM